MVTAADTGKLIRKLWRSKVTEVTHSGSLPKLGNKNLPSFVSLLRAAIIGLECDFISAYLCVTYGMEKHCNSRIAMFTEMPI